MLPRRQVTSVDVEWVHPELDVVADVGRGTGLPEASFDTVFCSQVLEHVAALAAFPKEAHRLTRPEGYLICATPFLFCRNGLPRDYYRYTPAAMAHLARQAGYEAVQVDAVGGLFAFLSTIPFTLAFNLMRSWPVWTMWPLFCGVAVCSWIDRLVDTSGRIPSCVLLVARPALTPSSAT